MKLLTDQEIARRLREAFGRYPVTDVSVEALCHNLQNPFEGYIIVDERDRILFLSDANEKFFAVPGPGAFLKPNKEINPTSHLTRVMRTGKAEVGEIAEFQGGQIRIVARFPIGRDGKVIGAGRRGRFARRTGASPCRASSSEWRKRRSMLLSRGKAGTGRARPAGWESIEPTP